MKQYKVCISDDCCPYGDTMVCQANNKTEARKIGRQYIKAWQLHRAKIEYIKEIDDDTIK